jgi:hypothetical protein
MRKSFLFTGLFTYSSFCLFVLVLGIKSKASHMLSTCFNTKIYIPPMPHSPVIKCLLCTRHYSNRPHFSFFFSFIIHMCIQAWFISPPWPHLLPYHPLRPLPLPRTPSIPSRNYFALISNFVGLIFLIKRWLINWA